ncbi:MAG TPA: ATP-dependent Clp protease proteolytic subunit [Planctomycetota bacterium]|nr:ATP-dependent Clp protease proteolytic subunit [Planctomycetota bacterium]
MSNPHSGSLPSWLDDEDDEPTPGPSKPGMDGLFFERRLAEARILQVVGPITDRLARYCATRLFVMEQMNPEKPITVMINSPGGSADSGFAIYDLLRYIKPPVRTVVNGLCASAAILVLLGAERSNRFSLPESRFLLHQPSTMGRGTASDLDITAREILKLRERYNRIVSEACKRDIEKIAEDTRRDFWLSATEAKEYGLVSKVIQRNSELPEA